jgi:hypothetical protein
MELDFHRSFLPAMERWDTKVGFHDGDYHGDLHRAPRPRAPPGRCVAA